jgi:hypothetical protein
LVKVTRAFIDGQQVGFVVHHESVSPLELLKRAAAVGISHGQTHADKGIVYVNRYDWVPHLSSHPQSSSSSFFRHHHAAGGLLEHT